MAADTANKRFSAMTIGLPWRGVNRVPTGVVDDDERAAVLGLYSGFLEDVTGAVSEGTEIGGITSFTTFT